MLDQTVLAATTPAGPGSKKGAIGLFVILQVPTGVAVCQTNNIAQMEHLCHLALQTWPTMCIGARGHVVKDSGFFLENAQPVGKVIRGSRHRV